MAGFFKSLIFIIIIVFVGVKFKNYYERKKAELQNNIVFVTFYEENCRGSKALIPIIKEVREEFPNIHFVYENTYHRNNIIRNYNIKRLPLMVILVNGKEVDRLVSYQNYYKVKNFIQKNMNSFINVLFY